MLLFFYDLSEWVIRLVMLVVVTRRREREEDEDLYKEPRYEPSRAAPPVIVVTPGAQQPRWPYGALYDNYPQLEGGRRQFRVMGYEDEEQAPEGEVGNWYQ